MGVIGLVLFLVSYHSTVQLPGLNFPYLGCGVITACLYLFYIRRLPKGIIQGCALLLAIGGASALVAGGVGLSVRASSFIYMAYSLVCGAALFSTIRQLPKVLVARTLLIMAIVLIVGGQLEVTFDFIRQLSNSVSVYMHPNVDYSSWTRDLAIAGKIRPKFFASEPSILARNISLFVLMWCALSKDRYKIPIGLILIAIGGYIGHSPTVLAGVIGIIVLQVNELLARRNFKVSFALAVRFVATAVVTAVALGAIAYFNQDRIQIILAHGDASSLMRTVMPILVAQSVLSAHPLVGVGLGGRTLAEAYYADAFLRLGFDYTGLLGGLGELTNNLPNTLFLYLIQYGIVGFTALIVALVRVQRQFLPRFAFYYFTALLGFSSTLGAIQGVPVATVMFGILAAQPALSFARER